MESGLLCHVPSNRRFTARGLLVPLVLFLFLLPALRLNAEIVQDKITLSGRNLSLIKVFALIHKQTGYSFLYEDKLLRNASPVSVNAKDTPLAEVLDACMKGQNLSYVIKYNTVIIRKAEMKITAASNPETSPASPLPPKTIRGKITDEKGQPMPGVTVGVKGTSIATSTNASGDYSINVPDGAKTLQFSYVGFGTQEIAVGNGLVANITMTEATKDLNQVVVVGYGTQKKKNITGAVASYNANDIDQRPLVRVDQALVGQMAGVQVKQTTGVPGKGFSIQVRGKGSISASNEPLYVIDGFPLEQAASNASGDFSTGSPLDNINPNDIENIQVLKDAASAAIYGSRAANGVVLITTKQGKSGKPQLNVNVYTGYSERSRKLDLLSAEEWIDRAIEMHNAAWVASAPGRTASQTTDQRRVILGLAPGEVNTLLMVDDRWTQPGHPGLRLFDWQDEIFRKGLMQNYQVSASGGNEYVKYYASGNYVNQKGIVLGLDYTSYSARANVEITPNKNLRFGINLAPNYSVTNDPAVEGVNNVIQTGILFTPVQEDTMGLYPNAFNNGAYRWGTSPSSPVARLRNTIGRTSRFRTLASVFGEYKLFDGLALRTTVNLDNTDNNTKSYIPYTITGSLSSRLGQPGVGTSGGYSGFRRQTFVNENTLSYNKTLNSVHDVSVVAGASYNTGKLSNVSLTSNGGFNSSVITTLNAATAIIGNTTETKNVLLSYFGRLQYGFDNKYLVSASLRRDGSSRFGQNTKWGWFPSASLGWRVSQEKFFENIESVNDFKLRASWGKSGNYNIGDYSSIPLLTPSVYSFNNTQAAGQSPGGIVNPDLSWETSETLDYGFDIGLLKSRITASFDYYSKLNSALLLNVPIPGNTGFQTYLSNAGKVRNKGWEVEVATRNLTGKFTWNTSVNFSHNTNKVVALAAGQSQILIPSSFDIPHSILKVGQPLYSISVIRQLGILTQADLDKKAALFGSETVGDPKYFDANSDGVIDANDRVIVGHPTPDYTWGITNSVSFKGFDLSALVQGQWGGSIYSLLGRAVRRTGQDYSGNVLGVSRYRWRSTSQPGDGMTPKAYSTFGRIKNTDWLYSSDYWRIRNITLGYNLGTLINAKAVKSARVYVTVENFFGKDKYYGGFNPEAANTDLSGSTSFPEAGDYGGLPLAKSFIFGFNFTF